MIVPVSGSTPPQKLSPSRQVSTSPLVSFWTNRVASDPAGTVTPAVPCLCPASERSYWRRQRLDTGLRRQQELHRLRSEAAACGCYQHTADAKQSSYPAGPIDSLSKWAQTAGPPDFRQRQALRACRVPKLSPTVVLAQSSEQDKLKPGTASGTMRCARGGRRFATLRSLTRQKPPCQISPEMTNAMAKAIRHVCDKSHRDREAQTLIMTLPWFWRGARRYSHASRNCSIGKTRSTVGRILPDASAP